jgi:hypothetical protein
MRNAHILVGKSEGKKLLLRQRHSGDDNDNTHMYVYVYHHHHHHQWLYSSCKDIGPLTPEVS